MTEPHDLPEDISDEMLRRWLQQARPVPDPERQARFLSDLAHAVAEQPQRVPTLPVRLWRWSTPWSLLAAVCVVVLLALPVLRPVPQMQEVEPMKLGAAPPERAHRLEPLKPATESSEQDVVSFAALQAHLAGIQGLEWQLQADQTLQVRVPLSRQADFEKSLAVWPEPYHLEILSGAGLPSGRQAADYHLYRLTPRLSP